MSLDGHELTLVGRAIVTAVNERACGFLDDDGVEFEDHGPFSAERLLAEEVVAALAGIGYQIVKVEP